MFPAPTAPAPRSTFSLCRRLRRAACATLNVAATCAVAVVVAAAPVARADNPVIKDLFTADPAALVSGGRVYLYTGHDQAPAGGTNYVMNDWRVFSSGDLVHWTDHGSPLSVATFSWARADAWASQVVERNGKFYWYVAIEHRSIPGKAIGVAVADSPTGPFIDALGAALVTNNQTTQTNISWDDIDPTVFIDTDGQAYLYWGNTVLKWAKLKSNMVELDGAINVVPLTLFTEAPWLHKHDALYYLSFARGWPEQIAYATSTSPAGPWTYRGVITEPNTNTGTNHQAIIEFNGRSYFIYHTAALPGGGDYRRSVAIEELFYNADGTIQPIQQTSTGLDGVKQRLRSAALPDRYVRHANFDARIDASVTPFMDSQWKIAAGLSDASADAVSFESVNYPGYFLRQIANDFTLAKHDGTPAFGGGATFRRVPGLADATGVSFQSLDQPSRYVRHVGNLLALETVSTDADRASATFFIGPAVSATVTGASTLALGGNTTLQASATGTGPFTYQWFKNGSPLIGATGATLTIASAGPFDGGNFSVRATNLDGTSESNATGVSLNHPSRLAALSVRTESGPGTDVLTLGVIVSGSGGAVTKPFAVRGVGPGLARYGLTDFMADPTTRWFSGTTMTDANDDWDAATLRPALSRIGLDTLDVASRDAGFLAQPAPGIYTVQVGAKTEQRGVVLAEIYEADGAAARLSGMSVRAKAGTGQQTLIGGFIVAGTGTKRLIIRGQGPVLGGYGVAGFLPDPKITVYSGVTAIASNDNWANTPEMLAALGAIGLTAPPAGSLDAALLAELAPGAYTVHLTGAGRTTGVALIEIYELP